jgi:hypothetical protein
MAKLPGLTEYYATLGAPAINFGRGLLGYQDPVGTETMQNRMTEIEAGRTKGNVGYEDYGLTPVAGRMVGGLPELAVNNPTDFALAGSIGKYDFSPEGRTGLNYDFTPDQDTGSTGNAMLDYVNSGGVRNSLSNLKDSFSNMGSAQASEIAQPQNLGFRSMVDMANDANNFDSQFNNTPMQMSPTGPFNFQTRSAPTIDRSNVMGRDLEADDGAQIVDGLTSPYTVRGQIANDLRSLMSLPGRAKEGIMGSASALNEKLGDPAGYVSSKYGQAKEGIMGSAPMEFLRSLPTPGNMIMKAASFRNPLNPNASNYNIALANDLSMIKDPSNPYTESTSIGSDGKYNSGMLSGQNAVSGLGTNDPGKQMDKSISTTENTIANLSKQWSQLMKNNPAAYANKLAIHEARLQKKKEERAALEQARQASANALQASNRSRGTGGYQAGYGSDFMDGPSGTIGGQNQGLGGQQGKAGGTATMGSSAMGGIIGHGGTGGRPAQSGLASMFTRRR